MHRAVSIAARISLTCLAHVMYVVLQEAAAKCEPLRQQVQVLEQQLEDAQAQLAGAHSQIHTLSETVDAAIVVRAAAGGVNGQRCLCAVACTGMLVEFWQLVEAAGKRMQTI